MAFGFSKPLWTRRRFVSAAGIIAMGTILPPRSVEPASAQANEFRELRAKAGSARLRGPDKTETGIWGYDGAVPGPTIRVKRGEELKIRLHNELPEPTLIHWHGLRLPNAMDGVPHLTQSPVDPGQSFEYRFTPPDAGTFWYHSHLYSSEQLERGLYGALIVDEPTPVDVDRDVVLVLDDWRLNEDGSLETASFRSAMAAAHAGRHGSLLTANSESNLAILVRRNERVRLRLINAANSRIMPVTLPGQTAWVMALDGQPADPFVARDSRVVLSPGARVDLFVDVAGDAGTALPIIIETGNGSTQVARFMIEGEIQRAAPRGDPKPLPSNPLPARIDLKNALRIEVLLDGGAMSQLLMNRMRDGKEVPGNGIDPSARFWTLAGQASSGHHGPPLFTVKRDRAVTMAFVNRTAFPHAMHIHGHHFRLLDNLDDGWKPFWLDTVLVAPRQTARIAFVADNPGKWMIHCHMLEHQETGMAAWFQVSDR